MEPKLKAFLSSAQFNHEFAIEREGLPTIFRKQPLTAGFVLWRIEDYASPEDIEAHYSKHVDDSDLLILLLGKTFRAAVMSEFRRAVAIHIPVFAFAKQIEERDPEMRSFIDEVRPSITYALYSGFADLVEKLENSLFQYYFRGARQPDVLRWRAERSRRKHISQEERSLRLVAGILASDAAGSTKTKVIEALIAEAALSTGGAADRETIIDKAMKIVRSDRESTRTEIAAGLDALLSSGVIRQVDGRKIEIDSVAQEQYVTQRSNLADADSRLFTSLHNQHRDLLRSADPDTYRRVLTEVITQVVYDTAMDMVEQEFGSQTSPFPYDADELNRVVAHALTSISDLLQGGIAKWQPAVVSVLQSDNPAVISWLNRLRKAYWALAVLGMDPTAIEYAADHLRRYCIYLDSHIVIRMMVGAGGESAMCRQILLLGGRLGVEMRLSQALFKEIELAFSGANKTYHAADKDIPRALKFFEAIHRKSDIFDGYVAAKARKPDLSWANFINRFYSPSDGTKLERYLANELGIAVQPERDFSTEQHGRIEDITQRLLQTRRQMIRPPDNLSEERRAAWERQYLLRTNEARQMAIIYEHRSETGPNKKQYWFVTFDEFVYEVSAKLASDGDAFYGFPCYIKPATWLEIITNASPDPLPINTFREVLLSRDVQRVADQLEAEVISQMLQSRVDQDVESIETLRYMFADIVNRPAVQEAYQKVLEAEGVKKLAAGDKVKDSIIAGMKDKLSALEEELGKKAEEARAQQRKAEKADGRAKYLKRQLGRLTSGLRKKKKKER